MSHNGPGILGPFEMTYRWTAYPSGQTGIRKKGVVSRAQARELIDDWNRLGYLAATLTADDFPDVTGIELIHKLFNEDDVLVMIIAAVPEELVGPLLEGFAPFYNEHSGVVFISDIQVTRLVKFKG